jgi:DNA repair protein SbcD/Mre11
LPALGDGETGLHQQVSMPGFSFVHAADLHLDSPFCGLQQLPEGQTRVADALREATFSAFHAVVDLCIDRDADFLLVAGDVYDGADRSLRAQLQFRDGLRRLSDAGVGVYVVHGNHDPLDGWADSLALPPGVHVFGSDLESAVFAKDGVSVARIHGISYPTRAIDRTFGGGFRREGEEPFQIGLLHCHCGGDARHESYAPRSLGDLVAAGLDYWALGHIHESVVLRQADPFIGYPGNTQGRHINESGRRGCFLVRVNAAGKLEAVPEFITTDAVRWLASEVDITGLETMDSLSMAMEAELQRLSQQAGGRPVVTRMVICGRGPLHRSLTRPNAIANLLARLHESGAHRTPFIWTERITRRTRPEVDLTARREAQDFLGDLLRLINDIRRSPDEVAALRGVLTDLYDHGRAGRILDPLTDAALTVLLDDAESQCVDQLLEDDD